MCHPFSEPAAALLSPRVLTPPPPATRPHRCWQALLKFDASHNRLASAEGLEQLSNCRILRLSFNQIGPSLPAALGDPTNGLTKLEALDLDNNCLETLPPSFGGLAKLRTLRLFNNRLRRLPATGCLGPLTALVELRLRHNRLLALPDDVGGMASLLVLDVAHNGLVGILNPSRTPTPTSRVPTLEP